MDQRFLIEAMSRKPELFTAMVGFNRAQLKGSSACPLLSPLGNVGNALLHDPVVRRACADNSHRNENGWWDFSEESCRLVLLSETEVRNLALTLSAAVFAEEMALVLDRAQVVELRSLIGDEIFNYAIRRGRYQIGSLRPFLISCMPEARLAQRIQSLACAIMHGISRNWPEELRKLWIEKLSKADMATVSTEGGAANSNDILPVLRAEQRRILWFTLKKLLLREAAPQWVPCFD